MKAPEIKRGRPPAVKEPEPAKPVVKSAERVQDSVRTLVTGWQPITTAPANTLILCYGDCEIFVTENPQPRHIVQRTSYHKEVQVTHWMALPGVPA